MDNIIVLHRNPARSAELLDNRDVNEQVMILCRTLSNAHCQLSNATNNPSDPLATSTNRRFGSWLTLDGGRIYGPVDDNLRPWFKWVRAAPGNYRWAVSLLEGLLRQYQTRFGDRRGHRHKLWGMLPVLRQAPPALRAPEEKAYRMTPFPLFPAMVQEAYLRGIDSITYNHAMYNRGPFIVSRASLVTSFDTAPYFTR